ncbi:unnamed protein product, partial [Chrysoparadoxa australica]
TLQLALLFTAKMVRAKSRAKRRTTHNLAYPVAQPPSDESETEEDKIRRLRRKRRKKAKPLKELCATANDCEQAVLKRELHVATREPPLVRGAGARLEVMHAEEGSLVWLVWEEGREVHLRDSDDEAEEQTSGRRGIPVHARESGCGIGHLYLDEQGFEALKVLVRKGLISVTWHAGGRLRVALLPEAFAAAHIESLPPISRPHLRALLLLLKAMHQDQFAPSEPREPRVGQKKAGASEFYAAVNAAREANCERQRLIADGAELPPMLGLLPKLRPYQQAAVAWMMSREVPPEELFLAGGAPGVAQLLGTVALELQPGGQRSHVYFNALNGFLCYDLPTPALTFPVPRGGILADEMGLGKTVELLGLVIAHPWKPQGQDEGEREVSSSVNEEDAEDAEASSSEPLLYWNNMPVTHVGEVACICEATASNSHRETSWVECRQCSWQLHSGCAINAAASAAGAGGEADFLCVVCEIQRLLKAPQACKATLIVCPAPILMQWKSEIEKHIDTGVVKVGVYEGVQRHVQSRSFGMLSPVHLASYDVVLTTYDVLRDEVHHTGTSSKSLRSAKRYRVVPSPLPALKWWRVAIDEAQMVESTTSQAAEMALLLPAQLRWCISGTPIGRGNLDDLYGLLLFIRMQPFNNRAWWAHGLREAAEKRLPGGMERLMAVLSQVLWRTTKKCVLAQLDLPDQREEIQELHFSSIERHNYERLFKIASAALASRRGKDDDEAMINVPELQTLRQACCHPEVGHLRGRDTCKTMAEIQDDHMVKARLEAEEKQRLLIMNYHGRAGVRRLQAEELLKSQGPEADHAGSAFLISEARKDYQRVLKLTKEGRKSVAAIGEADVYVSSSSDPLPMPAPEPNTGVVSACWWIEGAQAQSLREGNESGQGQLPWVKVGWKQNKRVQGLQLRFRALPCEAQASATATATEAATVTEAVAGDARGRPGATGEEKAAKADATAAAPCQAGDAELWYPKEVMLQAASHAEIGAFEDVHTFELPMPVLPQPSTAAPQVEPRLEGPWQAIEGFPGRFKARAWRLVVQSRHVVRPGKHRFSPAVMSMQVAWKEAEVDTDRVHLVHACHNLLKLMEGVPGQEACQSRKELQEELEHEVEQSLVEPKAQHRHARLQLTRCTQSCDQAAQRAASKVPWWETYIRTVEEETGGYAQAELVEAAEAALISSDTAQRITKERRREFPGFSSLSGLRLALMHQVSQIQERRKVVLAKLAKLPEKPSQAELRENSECKVCRSDWGKQGPECRICKQLKAVEDYECLLAPKMRGKGRKVGEGLLSGQTANAFEKEGQIANQIDSGVLMILSMLQKKVNDMSRRGVDADWQALSELAHKDMARWQLQKREARLAVAMVSAHQDLLSKIDEMESATKTKQLVDSSTDLSSMSEQDRQLLLVGGLLEEDYREYEMTIPVCESDLKSAKSRITFLQNLGASYGEKECPVCCALITEATQMVVLGCRHAMCMDCHKLLAERRRKWPCPICRVPMSPEEAFVVSHSSSRGSSSVKGSWGTKVEALIASVRRLSTGEKSLVFSQFEDMLDIVGQALEANDVSFERIKGKKSFSTSLPAFIQDPEIQVLLLPIKTGAEG